MKPRASSRIVSSRTSSIRPVELVEAPPQPSNTLQTVPVSAAADSFAPAAPAILSEAITGDTSLIAGTAATPETMRLWLNFWQQNEREARKDARNSLVVHLQPWLKELADRVGSRMPQNVMREELVNEMNKRLIGLIEKFDPTHRISFELYAGKALVGACHDFLRRSGWVKRTDRKFRKEALAAKEQFVSESGRDPSDAEWAERLGITAEAFDRKKPRLHGHEMTSLSAGEGGPGESEYLTDHRTVDPQIQAQRSEVVRMLCRGLQEKERAVMLGYYLAGLTMKQIGDRMHLSEARVSQLHGRVLKTLRVKFARRRDDFL